MSDTATQLDAAQVWPIDANVVLTGFMGTGKSTVGRVLAARLGYDFVDTDDVIESQFGSIASIFARHGEARFREFEHDVALELAVGRRQVIATGGRFMLDDHNVAALAGHSRVCCLVATVDEIVERLQNDSGRHERPLLQVDDPRQRVEELLAERDARYRRFLRISTSRRSPDAIADEIIRAFAEPQRATLVGIDDANDHPNDDASDDASDDPNTGRSDAGIPIWVGAGLMTLVTELVGPIRKVEGLQADQLRSQIVITDEGRTLVVGEHSHTRSGTGVVSVPTTLPAGSLNARASEGWLHQWPSVDGLILDGLILDAAVVQASETELVEWAEILASLLAFADVASA